MCQHTEIEIDSHAARASDLEAFLYGVHSMASTLFGIAAVLGYVLLLLITLFGIPLAVVILGAILR